MDIREFVDVYSKHIYFEMNEEFENLVTMLEVETIMTGMSATLSNIGNTYFLNFFRDLVVRDDFRYIIYFNGAKMNLSFYIENLNEEVSTYVNTNFSNLREAFEFMREKIKTL